MYRVVESDGSLEEKGMDGLAAVLGARERVDRTLYYGAKALAQAAQNILLAGLFVLAGTSTNAAIDLSSVFVATLVASLVLGAAGGALVDRVGVTRGYAGGAVGRLAVAVLALVALGGPGFAWVVAFLYSAVSQVFTPAEMALVKTVQRSEAGRGHSLLVTLQYVGQGAGMLVFAPALYLWGGTAGMLLGAVVGFVGVAVLALALSWRLRGTTASLAQRTADALNLADAASFFLSEARAAYAVVTLSFKTMVSRAIVIALPFYLERDMGLEEDALVYLVAPGVVGVLVGLVWSARGGVSLSTALPVMRYSLVGMAVAVLAAAGLNYGVTAVAQYSYVRPFADLDASMNTTFVVAMPVAFLLGLVLTTSLVAARVVLTETAPQRQQGRVFALQEMMSEAVVAAPLLLMGVGVQYTGARPTLAVIGGLAIIAFLVMEVGWLRRQSAEAGRAAVGAAKAPA